MQQLALRIGKPHQDFFPRSMRSPGDTHLLRPSSFSVQSSFEAIDYLAMSRPKVSSTVAGVPSKRLVPLQ